MVKLQGFFVFVSSRELLQEAKSVHKLWPKIDVWNTASVCTGCRKCWILLMKKIYQWLWNIRQVILNFVT